MSTGAEIWGRLLEVRPGVDADLLERFSLELERWNRSVRLVGPKDLAGVRVQVADALLPFLLCPPRFPFLDIGSGAGLPALPVRIAFPEGTIVCLEPRGKRASFLRHAARILGLRGLEVLEERAEVVQKGRPELGGGFASVTARAVTDPRTLLAWARPFLRPGGAVYVLVGDEALPPTPDWVVERDLAYRSLPGLGARRVTVFTPAAGDGASA